MADVNHVVLVGRLTRDAELKYTSAGGALCRFSVAINRRRKSGDDWVEEVNFFDIVLWGRQGEVISQYLIKGKQVAVEGELRQSRWEQEGQSRSKVEISATNVQLLGCVLGGAARAEDGEFSSSRVAAESTAGRVRGTSSDSRSPTGDILGEKRGLDATSSLDEADFSSSDLDTVPF